MDLQTVWHESWLGWQLGKGHPTDPRRAWIARELLAKLDLPINERQHFLAFDPAIFLAHTQRYVDAVREGYSDEWDGQRKDLARIALSFYSGTLDMAYRALQAADAAELPSVYWNPFGAKHHAHADHSSGFCVFNDMAAAAGVFTRTGRRVFYVDWDVHHGDGVEAMLRDDPLATTFSIHQGGIFPGTGLDSQPLRGVYNRPLTRGAGDVELLGKVKVAVDVIRANEPAVILVAAGADGLANDPLAGLTYTHRGLAAAGGMIGQVARDLGVPVIIGGAGGYLPLDETPRAWAATVATLWATHQGIPPETVRTRASLAA